MLREIFKFTFFGFMFVSCSNSSEIKLYPNGNKLYEVPLKNGEKNGLFVEYYENGKIKREVPYKEGQIEGLVKNYDSIGNLIGKMDYKNNLRQGEFYGIYPSGAVEIKGFYKNDKPDSLGFQYYENGELYKVYYYDMGNLRYYLAFDKEKRVYDSKLPIIVKPMVKQEAYPINKPHEVIIKLDYSYFPNSRIRVIVGNLNEKNYLTDTTVVFNSDSLSTMYVDYPKKRGINEIAGEVAEIIMPDNLVMGRYFFRYQYNVK